jgi:hypothetical protein
MPSAAIRSAISRPVIRDALTGVSIARAMRAPTSDASGEGAVEYAKVSNRSRSWFSSNPTMSHATAWSRKSDEMYPTLRRFDGSRAVRFTGSSPAKIVRLYVLGPLLLLGRTHLREVLRRVRMDWARAGLARGALQLVDRLVHRAPFARHALGVDEHAEQFRVDVAGRERTCDRDDRLVVARQRREREGEVVRGGARAGLQARAARDRRAPRPRGVRT